MKIMLRQLICFDAWYLGFKKINTCNLILTCGEYSCEAVTREIKYVELITRRISSLSLLFNNPITQLLLNAMSNTRRRLKLPTWGGMRPLMALLLKVKNDRNERFPISLEMLPLKSMLERSKLVPLSCFLLL